MTIPKPPVRRPSIPAGARTPGMKRPTVPGPRPTVPATAAMKTPGARPGASARAAGKARLPGRLGEHLTGSAQHAATTGKEKAASVLGDVAREAAIGAGQGAMAAGVGSLPGAAKGVVKGLLKNKHARKVLVGILAVLVILPLLGVAGTVVALSVITGGSTSADTGASMQAALDSGNQSADVQDAIDKVSGSSIPWPLYLTMKQQTGSWPDVHKLQTALDKEDPSGQHQDMTAGALYSSGTAGRALDTKDPDAVKGAAKVESVWEAVMVSALGVTPETATSIYQQALIMVLGQSPTNCGMSSTSGGSGTSSGIGSAGVILSTEQTGNASVIIGIAKTIWANDDASQKQAAIVGIATAQQESGIRNLTHGDRDSLGMFQQRASWGTAAQREDPSYSSAKFLTRLETVAGWQQMPVAVAAQTVQVSAFPDAYAKWEGLARATVTALWDSSPALPLPSTVTDPGQAASAGSPSGATSTATTCIGGGLTVSGNAVNPLGTQKYTIANGFGPRAAPTEGASTFHEGDDMAAPCGTPIYAAMAGTVVHAGIYGTGGNVVILDNGSGVQTYYMHQPDVNGIVVHVGDTVKVGQLIGHIGSTGVSTGCHLHFGVTVNQAFVDPQPFMSKLGVII